MSFFKSFFEWWQSKKDSQQTRELAFHQRFDDLLVDLKPATTTDEPNYMRKAPIENHSHEHVMGSVKEYFEQKPAQTELDQNLKEALHIAENAHFLSDDQRASSLISLIGEEEAILAIKALRWRQGLYCPFCGSTRIERVINPQKLLETYLCLNCQEGGHSGEFDDLTNYFDDYEINSIRLWILIAYLRTFLPMSKVAKVLGMSLEQAVRLIDLMTPKDQSKNIARKARRSDSYFS